MIKENEKNTAFDDKGSSLPSMFVRYVLNQKKRYYLGIFPNMGGGVFPNPKTFVNLPSIFLYAKLGPKWPQMVKNML